MKTKQLVTKLLIGFIIYSFALISCSSSPPSENPVNKSALAEIRKEPKVKEAIITDADVLYVSVEDDGTSRNGYALYLGQILLEHGATTKWIKVVKVNSMNDPNKDNAYGVLLGEARID